MVAHMRDPRAIRDAAIALGSAGAGVGFLMAGAAVLLSMISVIRLGYAPTSYDIGEGLDLTHDLGLVAAFAIATLAIAGGIERRERRLAFAAIVAAVSFAAWIAAYALFGVSEPRGLDALVTIDVLRALAASALVVAAVAATVAFRRAESAPPDDQAERDGLLAWASVSLGVGLSLLTASAIVQTGVVPFPHHGNLTLAVIGSAIGLGGAVIGAIAFVVSRSKQRRASARWITWREALIAAALAVFVVGFVVTAIGAVTVAHASAQDRVPQLFTASHWLDAISQWILSTSVAVAAVGFVVSATQMEARRRTSA
jgi:hypothetical protein